MRNNISRFIIFFLLVAFTITCNFFVFFHSAELSLEMMRRGAINTLINVIIITILFVVLDTIQRRISIERPVQEILKVTQEIAKGNFSARVPQLQNKYTRGEFNEIAQNVNILAEELSGIETLRTDFISNVSHELKTPLSVISNYSTMLSSPNLTYEQEKEYATGITDAADRLADLISNILKLNKLENQQIYPQACIYDLSEQVRECILHFETVWEEQKIELETQIQDDIQVKADQDLLAIVWNNLLSNAFKFTNAGGIVSVAVWKEGSGVWVTVSDTGCGMDETTKKHIFEKFYQGDRSHLTVGNGLGLSLVRRVLDVVHGEITVESNLGKGSKFLVYLPQESEEIKHDV